MTWLSLLQCATQLCLIWNNSLVSLRVQLISCVFYSVEALWGSWQKGPSLNFPYEHSVKCFLLRIWNHFPGKFLSECVFMPRQHWWYVVFRLNHPILINMIFPTRGNIFMSATHVGFYHIISVWFCLDMDMDFNLSSAAKPQGGNFSCHSVEGHQNDTSFCSSTTLKSSMPTSVTQPNCWLAVIHIK